MGQRNDLANTALILGIALHTLLYLPMESKTALLPTMPYIYSIRWAKLGSCVVEENRPNPRCLGIFPAKVCCFWRAQGLKFYQSRP